ncbi:hypothetical protein AB6A40_009874 [Gnathostoma spinigerum]|uniref:NADH dehydrogenase subunit 5 n=1 Tax=Gnathostoma spinigerum TaxID=75299 RepID=A0ABD6ET68_9BILA
MSVLRGYLAKVSVDKDRARVFASFGLSFMLAMSVGPVIQLLFSLLGYPGLPLFSQKIHLSIYSGPIFAAIFTNILSLSLVVFFLKDCNSLQPHQKGDIRNLLQITAHYG